MAKSIQQKQKLKKSKQATEEQKREKWTHSNDPNCVQLYESLDRERELASAAQSLNLKSKRKEGH